MVKKTMAATHILVVDDEPDIRDLVREILQDEGYAVSVAADAEEARAVNREQGADLALLDIWMPGTDGITLLQEWQRDSAAGFPVIMMSGHGTIETAVEATRLGAFDFVEKPLSLTKLLSIVRTALARDGTRETPAGSPGARQRPELIGNSRALGELRERVQRVAASLVPTLVIGEPGSGRRTVAHLIHVESVRATGPCIVFEVQPESAQADEEALLGTGGAWSQAAGGTLVIDDIAALSPPTQARISATLAANPGPHQPRLIGVTREPLEALAARGDIRANLPRGIAVSLQVPPLREHAEDVPELIGHFVDHFVEHHGLAYRHFPVSVQNRLRHAEWPANVAGLEAVVKRLLVLAESSEITLAEVDRALAETPSPVRPATMLRLPLDLPLREAREVFERAYLEYQLHVVEGRIGELARRVGMERTHLYRKLKSLGIDHTRSRPGPDNR